MPSTHLSLPATNIIPVQTFNLHIYNDKKKNLHKADLLAKKDGDKTSKCFAQEQEWKTK